MEEVLRELKMAQRNNLVTIGSKSVIKGLLKGKIRKVIIASNCPEEIKERIKYYAKLAGAEVVEVELNNMQLGASLGKPFGAAAVGILYGSD